MTRRVEEREVQELWRFDAAAADETERRKEETSFVLFHSLIAAFDVVVVFSGAREEKPS